MALRSRLAAAACALGLATSVAPARAYDAELEATTTGQTYQLNGRAGDPILTRRRVIQTLALGVYKLAGDDRPGGPQLFFRARMRLDGDASLTSEGSRIAPNADQSLLVPGLFPVAPVDVMYGYLEGRRLAGGFLGFRLGRQQVVDSLGFYSFDGALVQIMTPAYFTVELYGGLEVRAGMPLSNGRWQLGGVQRGNRDGFSQASYASFNESHIAPVYGIALESVGPTWIHGRVTYRKAFNTGGVFVAGPGLPKSLGLGRTLGLGAYDATRVSSERLGYAVNVDVGELASLRGAMAYDFYSTKFNSAEAGADLFLSQRVTAGLDYQYWRPIFDADSIFNSFNLDPMDDLSARMEVNPTDRISLEGDAMVRRYRSDDQEDVTRVATSYAPGAGARARYTWPTARGTVRYQMLSGDQGNRYGSDLFYERAFGTRWMADARLSLWHFSDKLRADDAGRSRTATSFGYTIGAGYRLAEGTTAMVQMEEDLNRLIGQRIRVMAVLTARLGL